VSLSSKRRQGFIRGEFVDETEGEGSRGNRIYTLHYPEYPYGVFAERISEVRSNAGRLKPARFEAMENKQRFLDSSRRRISPLNGRAPSRNWGRRSYEN
jgi:hypothetical protein